MDSPGDLRFVGGQAARHLPHLVRYDPAWWSVVFPLGMYGVGGYYPGQAHHLPIVQSISADGSWAALAPGH